MIFGDLVLRAWGIDPVFSPEHLAEPAWLARSKAGSEARFYVGGKRNGTLDSWDLDAPRAFFNPQGLVGSASRAALSRQAVFYPSAWHAQKCCRTACRCCGRSYSAPRVRSFSKAIVTPVTGFWTGPACAIVSCLSARPPVTRRFCKSLTSANPFYTTRRDLMSHRG